MRIIIAGGGTGGHLFPGIAIAEAFMKQDPSNSVLFVSSGNPFELSVLSKTDFRFEKIASEGIKDRILMNKIKSVIKIPRGMFQAMLILKKFKPDLVVGVGSYSSGPPVLCAWLLGINIVLHEQNILPGITNRILSYFADRIYVSFKKTQMAFKRKKVYLSGNPVRKEIIRVSQKQLNTYTYDNEYAFIQNNLFTILIIGGSQGARRINTVIIDTLTHLKAKDSFFFVHQTGAVDEEKVKRAYLSHGLACNVKPFFSDMGLQYKLADLVICRAGATTISEITAIGKGAILIPYPFAADNHQVLNALTLADIGAAEMIVEKDLNAKLLASRIDFYASSPDALDLMATRSKTLGRPNAAEDIVNACYDLMD